MLPGMVAAVHAFISYSHDSLAHAERVVKLASRLRADGVDVDVDQWVESPPEGWPRWMERQVRKARFVLVVCTETYDRLSCGEETAAQQRDVSWQSLLTYQYLYDAGSENHRFIPIVFSRESAAHVPTPLRGTTCYDLSTDDGYQRLYRRLTEQPDRVKPPLGAVRKLQRDAESAGEDSQADATLPSHSLAVSIAGYTRPSLRDFLMRVLVGDVDLDAFCADFFPEVRQLFSSEMTRLAKVNMLFDREDGARILHALKETHQERYERFLGVLKKAV